ncbi:MAG: CerR family C-terminal domain-containing protein [Pirellulaceae bacterium]
MSTDDTRSRVLDAAGAEFADKGFERATVRDICRRAGVNLASVNYYFGDKEQLYVETVKEAQRMRSAQVPAPQWDADTPPEQMLRDFVGMLLNRMLRVKTAPWHSRLMMREVLSPTKACREMSEEFIRPQFEMLLGIISRLASPSAPLHLRQQIAFSVVGQCLHYRLAGEIVEILIDDDTRRRHYQIESLADQITQFTLAALGAAPPLGTDKLGDRLRSKHTPVESLPGKQ